MSTIGVSPVTVTVSCTPPTRSSPSTAITPVPLTSTLSRLTVTNPGRVKVTTYVPGRRSSIRYRPAPSVAVVRTFSISAGLEASTVTPGSTAPDESLTAPAIVACAHAVDCAAMRHASTNNVRTHTRICEFSVSWLTSPGRPRLTRPSRTSSLASSITNRTIVYRATPPRVSSRCYMHTPSQSHRRGSQGHGGGVFPKTTRGKLGADRERPELRPRDFCMDWPESSERSHATVCPGHNTVSPDDVGVASDALSHELGMLDVVGAGIDDSRHEHLLLRERVPGPDFPFVLVARIGAFDQERRWLCPEHGRQNHLQRNVVCVGALVIAPAHVHPHPVGRNIGDRCIQRIDMDLGAAQELGVVQVLEARVPAHRKVRAVDLQNEAGPDDVLVLHAHRRTDRVHVGFVRSVVLVRVKDANRAG